MQKTVTRHTMYPLSILGLAAILATTGCHKKTEATDNAAAASVAESQAVSMSAAPADSKHAAVVSEATATVDVGPDAVNNASATAKTHAMPASDVEALDEGDDEADNSEMDKISENDKVIDNEPASPNAPKAQESKTPVVGNQKVGQ